MPKLLTYTDALSRLWARWMGEQYKPAGQVSPHEVEAESLRTTFRHYVLLGPVCVFAAVFLYVTAEHIPPGSYTLEWIAVCVAFHGARTLLSLAFLRVDPLDATQLRRWDRIALSLNLFEGLMAMTFALWIWPLYPMVEQLIQLMTVTLLVAGTSFTLAGRWRTITAFAPPTYLGFAWSASQLEHVYALPVTILVLVFFGLYLLNARSHHRANVHGLELARQLERKNGQLQELASSRSRLLATVSHDLRQPSHAIGLLSDRAMRESDPAQLRDTLRDLNELSQSLGASLSTLMDLTRLDAGLVQANLQPLPLSQVLIRLDAEFAGTARHKGLSLLLPHTELWVRSDPVLLHGVLSNLTSNALKFTPAGQVSVELEVKNQEVELCVNDTGIGISSEKFELMFKEFVRLEGGPSRTEGLGLGLSIVKRYATLMGHEVQVRSRPGQGSRFSIALPLCRPEGRLASQLLGSALDLTELAGLHVLVVDNVELVLSSMVRTLAAWGCHAHAARSLDEALRVARLHSPDLLITDHHLGEGQAHGLSLVRALRALHPQTRLPALLMTGDVSSQLEHQAALDQVGILHKPVRPSVLSSALITVISDARSAQLLRS